MDKRRYIPDGAVLIPAHADCVFEGKMMKVWQWPQTLFDGSVATYEMPRAFDVVLIIAEVDGKFIVCEEEQPLIGKFLGIPAGSVEFYGDEDELDCAKRELGEETGYTLSEWRLLDCLQMCDRIEQFFYVFYAAGTVGSVSSSHDPGEKIIHKLVSYEELLELAPKMRSYQFIRNVLERAPNANKLRKLPSLYEEGVS